MTLSDDLAQIRSVFIDTAPIIYYIEAHPQYGPLVKDIVTSFQSGRLNAFSSVITLVEVLPKPIEAGNETLAKQFSIPTFSHHSNPSASVHFHKILDCQPCPESPCLTHVMKLLETATNKRI